MKATRSLRLFARRLLFLFLTTLENTRNESPARAGCTLLLGIYEQSGGATARSYIQMEEGRKIAEETLVVTSSGEIKDEI